MTTAIVYSLLMIILMALATSFSNYRLHKKYKSELEKYEMKLNDLEYDTQAMIKDLRNAFIESLSIPLNKPSDDTNYVDRMIDELAELEERISKIRSIDFPLDSIETEMLREQYYSMVEYKTILEKRIVYANQKNKL